MAVSDFYTPCPGCGIGYGRGKGVFGLGRHRCEDRAYYAHRFAMFGADIGMIARALECTVDQALALLEAGNETHRSSR